jgi:hypothetical protein
MEPNSEFSKKLKDPPSAPFHDLQLLCIYGLNVMDGQSKTKRTCKQTDKQTNITFRQTELAKADKQTNRQTDKQTNRQADKQTNRQTDKQTNRQTDKQTNRQTDKQTNRQTDKQTNRQTNKQTTTDSSKLLKTIRSQRSP